MTTPSPNTSKTNPTASPTDPSVSSSSATPTKFSPIPAAGWLVLAVPPLLFTLVGWTFFPNVAPSNDGQSNSGSNDAVVKDPPTPTMDVVLNSRIRIIDADVPEEPISKGSRLSLKFFFETLGDLDRDWDIFLHIDKQGSGYRIHGDHKPADGKYTTTQWRKGDVIVDAWSQLVPLDAPSGTYDIWLGFYVGDTRMQQSGGDRQRNDGNNRIRVGSFTIK